MYLKHVSAQARSLELQPINYYEITITQHTNNLISFVQQKGGYPLRASA